MVRKRYGIRVWGTVLFLDLGSASIIEGEMDAAVESIKSFVYEVDELFSTYKDGSFVSRLRRGEISIDECPADLQGVWQLCAVARDLTDSTAVSITASEIEAEPKSKKSTVPQTCISYRLRTT